MSKLIDNGPFRRSGIVEYVKRMTKPLSKPVYDTTVTSLLTKAGYDIPEDPASIYDPEQLWTQLDRFVGDTEIIEDAYVKSAIARAFRAFGKRDSYDAKPLLTEEEHLAAMQKDKSAGIYFASKADAWPRGWTRAFDVIDGKKRPNPCLAGVRTQRGNKTRLVWGYPLEMTILEARFARPLIDIFKEIRSPMPYALRRHELGSRLEYTLTERNKVALDFSKFDASVPSHLIRVAFRILKTWFKTFSKDDEKAWKIVVNYFINTPIVMIDGHLYSGKDHGVPSGSYFTQLIDSIVNYIIISAAMLKFGLHPHERKIHVLGDDSVFSTNENVNLSELQTYFKTMGFNLNIDKSEVVSSNQSVHFIGFDWYQGTPFRDEKKALLSMTQPEKYRTREKERPAERVRAMRLIFEMTTLGANLYEVLHKVHPESPGRSIFFNPSTEGLTGYSKFRKAQDPTKIWHNIGTGLWI